MLFFRYFAFLFFCTFLYSCKNNSENKFSNSIKSKIDILSESIQKEPDNDKLLYERATYNYKRNNFELAIFDLNKCFEIDSSSYKYNYLLAEIYLKYLSKGDLTKGDLFERHTKKALILNNNDFKIYNLFAEWCLINRQFEDAIKYLNKSLEIEYNQAKTHMNLGYSFKQINRQESAIDCFLNALNIDPEYKEAYMQLAVIYHGELDSLAINYYNTAIKLDPKDETALYNKAKFYQDIQDWNKALDAYSKLHKINPFHPEGHYNIGFIHMELGLYDIASNNFSDAIYSNAYFFEAYYARGHCFETLGNIAQAEVDYRRSVEINPDYVFAKKALNNLVKKNKKFKK